MASPTLFVLGCSPHAIHPLPKEKQRRGENSEMANCTEKKCNGKDKKFVSDRWTKDEAGKRVTEESDEFFPQIGCASFGATHHRKHSHLLVAVPSSDRLWYQLPPALAAAAAHRNHSPLWMVGRQVARNGTHSGRRATTLALITFKHCISEIR